MGKEDVDEVFERSENSRSINAICQDCRVRASAPSSDRRMLFATAWLGLNGLVFIFECPWGLFTRSFSCIYVAMSIVEGAGFIDSSRWPSVMSGG